MIGAAAQPSLPAPFKSQTVASPAGAEIFVRSAGSGPVVVPLHGYAEPATHGHPSGTRCRQKLSVGEVPFRKTLFDSRVPVRSDVFLQKVQ